jgi:hypothetical protein
MMLSGDKCIFFISSKAEIYASDSYYSLQEGRVQFNTLLTFTHALPLAVNYLHAIFDASHRLILFAKAIKFCVLRGTDFHPRMCIRIQT